MRTLRTLLLFFPLLLFAFVSCGKRNDGLPALQRVALLANTHPDSAMALLDSLRDSIFLQPRSVRMYYDLLTVKARDKAYIRHTSDSLIRSVLRYYERQNDKKHLPETYYYAGRVYSDLGDAPQALNYFIRASETADGKDYDLLSRIYSQIGTLYLYQAVYDKALPVFRKCYQYNLLEGDSAALVYCIRNIGRAYSVLNQVDSALYYYKEADSLAIRLGSNFLRRKVNGELSAYYTQLGMYKEAYKCLQMALSQMSLAERAPRYSTAARYYFSVNQIDSAYYYSKRMTEIERYSYKKEGYEGLARIARLRGNYEKAFEYFDKYLVYADSTSELVRTEAVRKINALYNYQLREEENNRLLLQNKHQRWEIILTTLILVALGALFFAYWQNRKRKEEERANQLRKLRLFQEVQYRQSQAYIEENLKRIAELEKELQEVRTTSDISRQELLHAQKLSLEKDNEQVEAQQKMEQEAVKAFQTSAIYIKFHETDDKILEEDWSELISAIDNTYRHFTQRLKDLYPMNEVELQVCLLLKIDMPFKRIAQLVLRSKQAVTSIRKRLYKKVFGREGTPDDWDRFIRNF